MVIGIKEWRHLDSVDMNVDELDFAMWWWDIMEPHSLAVCLVVQKSRFSFGGVALFVWS